MGDHRRFIFIDFEASSLSEDSWPIEVGLASLAGSRIRTWSSLIRPEESWPMAAWSDRSQQVHKISLEQLNDVPSAGEVARQLIERAGDAILISDAPTFDQAWLDRLLDVLPECERARLKIAPEDVLLSDPRVHTAAYLRHRWEHRDGAAHRAAADARRLAQAFEYAMAVGRKSKKADGSGGK
ncbi:exonuclease domain-containing protein [Histidinibacterium lentulum]|uniref:Exonuclease domain-containing protein n=1 Tax=Histidinibacterium lentulum TaxID=2480588 RepID=A0A3N2QRL6_9RHOB|nr:exonuclease domain-containing protein [Histidinibacterium lentulum]ROT97829.1 hypothetical protein EAT49_18695 [Histidinibacterium lentulum]